MKITKLTFILLLSVILSGLMAAGYVSADDKEGTTKLVNQNPVGVPESYTATSISKETILLLLAVGVIGALGLSRKKKGTINPAQKNEANRAPNHKNLSEKS